VGVYAKVSEQRGQVLQREMQQSHCLAGQVVCIVEWCGGIRSCIDSCRRRGCSSERIMRQSVPARHLAALYKQHVMCVSMTVTPGSISTTVQ